MTDTITFADSLLSDMHKDAFGSRPRGVYPDVMTMDEYHAYADRLQEIILSNMDWEREREIAAQRSLESRVARYQEQFNIDRGTALRWEIEAATGDSPNHGVDVGYWAYLTGISYDLAPMYRDELAGAGVTGLRIS